MPVDELDDCNSALMEAIKIAKMSGGKITVIYVHPKWSTFILDSKEALPEKLKKEAVNILVKSEKQARAEGFEVETLLLDGDPVQQIVKTANDKHFDLIVMGARRKSNLTGLILGSQQWSIEKRIMPRINH